MKRWNARVLGVFLTCQAVLQLWLCALAPSPKPSHPADAAARALRLSIEAALQPSTYSARNAEAARSVARDAAVLEGLARPIAWKDGDLDLLNGTWDLIYTSNGDVDRGNFRQLGWPGQPILEKVQQEIDVKAGRLRNVLTLSPWPSSSWPLAGPFQGVLQELEAARIVLRLDHSFEAYGQSRLRIVLERLDRSLEGPSMEGLASLIPRSSSMKVDATKDQVLVKPQARLLRALWDQPVSLRLTTEERLWKPELREAEEG